MFTVSSSCCTDTDTENRLLKNLYANLTREEKLQNSCTLLKMREQLNIFYEHKASWEL